MTDKQIKLAKVYVLDNYVKNILNYAAIMKTGSLDTRRINNNKYRLFPISQITLNYLVVGALLLCTKYLC